MIKILIIIAGLITTMPVYATTMCTINDTVAVVLDPSIQFSNTSANATTFTWSAWNKYGTIHGTAACINKGPYTQGQHKTLLKDDRDNDGILRRVIGSEKYGKYCWCKLTHPVSSKWTYNSENQTAARCASICYIHCGTAVYKQYLTQLHGGMISSVASDL